MNDGESMPKWNIKYISVSIIIIWFVLGAISRFQDDITEYVSSETLRLVKQTVQYHKSGIQKMFNDQFYSLDIIAIELNYLPSNDVDTVVQFLQNRQSTTTFDIVAIARIDGKSVSNNARFLELEEQEYFIKALSGEQTISNIVQTADGRDVIVSALPIYNHSSNEVIGVAIGANYLENISLELKSTTFNGLAHAYIVDQVGTIIGGVNDFSLYNGENLYTYFLNNKTKIEQFRPDSIRCHHSDNDVMCYNQNYLSYYTSLGIQDWSYVTLIPLNEIDFSVRAVQQETLDLTVQLILAGVVVLGVIVYRYNKNRKISHIQFEKTRMNEEKYRLVLQQSETMIFEYNIHNNKIELSDHFKNKMFLSDVKQVDYTPEFFVKAGYFSGQCAIDYLKLFQQIKSGQSLAALTVPLRLSNGKINWYELELITIFDSCGLPIRAIGRIINVNQQRLNTLHLIQKTKEDSMTKVYNKISTEQEINALLHTRTDARKSAMVLIDIDDFKTINDTFGHSIGDTVIMTVATSLKVSFGEEVVVGRIGGDEFLVYIDDVDSEVELYNQLDELCERLNACYLPRTNYQVSASIGVLQIDGSVPDFKTMYSLTDEIMYQAKKNGKNQWVVQKVVMFDEEYQILHSIGL